MTRVSLKGIVIGGVTAILVTFTLSLPVLMVAMAQLKLVALPEPERTAAVMKAMGPDSSYYVVGLVLGVGAGLLGGYVAARLAKHDARLNGALSAWLCVLFGLYSWATPGYAASALARVGFLLLSPAVGAAGGYLYERQHKHVVDREAIAPA